MDSPRAANATLTRVGACSWPNASWTTVGRCAAPRSASRPPCRRRPGGQPVPGAGGGQQSARGDDRPIESAAAQPDPGAPPGGAPSRPGAGHRVLGRERGTPNSRAASAARAGSRPVTGYGYVHTALDDHSRLAYSAVLADETAATTVAWWQRAIAWFAGHGIRIERVLTDNGACYRSRAWVDTCRGHKITAKRTRPYRPPTNDKVERYHRTLLVEWAYARVYTSDAARTAALRKWLHFYNHHRTHTALGGLPPASRVTNLSGQNT